MNMLKNNSIVRFSKSQIQWAALHDWFIAGNASEITCLNQWSDGRSEIVKHTNFRQLREWAGY